MEAFRLEKEAVRKALINIVFLSVILCLLSGSISYPLCIGGMIFFIFRGKMEVLRNYHEKTEVVLCEDGISAFWNGFQLFVPAQDIFQASFVDRERGTLHQPRFYLHIVTLDGYQFRIFLVPTEFEGQKFQREFIIRYPPVYTVDPIIGGGGYS